jgi:hypothetical protein
MLKKKGGARRTVATTHGREVWWAQARSPAISASDRRNQRHPDLGHGLHPQLDREGPAARGGGLSPRVVAGTVALTLVGRLLRLPWDA